MDKAHISHLHQRLFAFRAAGRPVPGRGRGLDYLELDRLRGRIDAEGYGLGHLEADARERRIKLPARPAGCICRGCQENAESPGGKAIKIEYTGDNSPWRTEAEPGRTPKPFLDQLIAWAHCCNCWKLSMRAAANADRLCPECWENL